MRSSYVTAIVMVAATLSAGCSDGSSQSTGKVLPAPMSSTEADGTPAPPEAAADPAFAAFDRDSNGMVDDSEWQNNEARNRVELKNRTFQQIDRDSSGGIDPDEFASARTDGDPDNGGAGRTVHDSNADPDTPSL